MSDQPTAGVVNANDLPRPVPSDGHAYRPHNFGDNGECYACSSWLAAIAVTFCGRPRSEHAG